MLRFLPNALESFFLLSLVTCSEIDSMKGSGDDSTSESSEDGSMEFEKLRI